MHRLFHITLLLLLLLLQLLLPLTCACPCTVPSSLVAHCKWHKGLNHGRLMLLLRAKQYNRAHTVHHQQRLHLQQYSSTEVQ